MNHRRGRLLALLVLAVLSFAADAGTHAVRAEQPTAGMRVYVDPTTGKFVESPPAAEIIHQPRSGRSAETVVEVVPGTTAAGGVLAQIPPNLAAEVRVVVQPDGHLSTECTQGSSRGQ